MIRNGTTYSDLTDEEVVDVLEAARVNGTRIRVHYGNTTTGKDWGDDLDVTGKVSRSMGPVQVPLLVHNSRSMGGFHIEDHCIVKITTTRKPKTTLYQHPGYFVPGTLGGAK